MLLHEAGRLELSSEQAARRKELLAPLEPASGFSADELRSLDTDALEIAVHDFLRALRSTASRAAKIRRRLPLAP